MNSTVRVCTCVVVAALLPPVSSAQLPWLKSSAYFIPDHRLSGIGVDRGTMSEDVLARRTQLMIESQTFGIMRDYRSIAGAQRITSPKMQAIFQSASKESGWPASLLSAI